MLAGKWKNNISYAFPHFMTIFRRSIPQEIYLSNTTQYSSETIDKESDIGPQVTHLYTLKNKGPAEIYEAEMYFLWPWQTLAGKIW